MANTTLVRNANSTFRLANGTDETIDFEIPFAFKDGTDKREVSRVCTLAYDISTKFNQITKGYFELVPIISNVIAEESWKALEGCKSLNSFIMSITGASKSQCSEMVKVAKTFYVSGVLSDPDYGLFSYTELVALSNVDEDVRENVLERIRLVGEKHTRKDVLEALKEERLKALEEKNNTEYGEDVKADSEDESSADSEDESSAAELETDSEPLAGDVVEEKSEWSNVTDTINIMDVAIRLSASLIKGIIYDKKKKAHEKESELAEIANGLLSLAKDDYNFDVDAVSTDEPFRYGLAMTMKRESLDGKPALNEE